MAENNNTPENKAIKEWLLSTLYKVKSGQISTEEALRELSVLPYEDLNFVKIDHHRDIHRLPRSHFRARQDCRANCDYRGAAGGSFR